MYQIEMQSLHLVYKHLSLALAALIVCFANTSSQARDFSEPRMREYISTRTQRYYIHQANMAQNKYSAYEDEYWYLRLDSNLNSFKAKLYSESNIELATFENLENEFKLPPQKVGSYKLIISSSADVPLPPNTALQLAVEVTVQKRNFNLHPTPKSKTAKPIVSNQQHPWQYDLSLEGAGITLFSKSVITANKPNPSIAAGLVRLTATRDRHEFELGLKSKLTNLNSAGSDYSPTSLEARYKYLQGLPWNPFPSLKNASIGYLLGFETYANNSGNSFSPRYDVLKLGFSLKFPIKNNFETGGEILYGRSFEASSKAEISGYVGYLFPSKSNRPSQLNFGYRAFTFEAGSASSSPTSSSGYREAYAELYSGFTFPF